MDVKAKLWKAIPRNADLFGLLLNDWKRKTEGVLARRVSNGCLQGGEEFVPLIGDLNANREIGWLARVGFVNTMVSPTGRLTRVLSMFGSWILPNVIGENEPLNTRIAADINSGHTTSKRRPSRGGRD
jgi:hypothetical protein